MTDEQLLQYIVDTVNGTGALSVTATQDYLAPSGECVSVQMLDGSTLATEFLDGSGIMEIPFAVLRRTAGTDSAGRRGAAGELMALSTALNSMRIHGVPVLSMRSESTPTLIERNDNGTEVWRASYMLESYRSSTGA